MRLIKLVKFSESIILVYMEVLKREKDQRILVTFKMEVADDDRGCYFSGTSRKLSRNILLRLVLE